MQLKRLMCFVFIARNMLNRFSHFVHPGSRVVEQEGLFARIKCTKAT